MVNVPALRVCLVALCFGCLTGIAAETYPVAGSPAQQSRLAALETVVVNEASLVLTQDGVAQNETLEVVQLPDYWGLNRRLQSVTDRYQMAVTLRASGSDVQRATTPERLSATSGSGDFEPLGLFIPNMSGRLLVYWDGQFIGKSIPFTGRGVPLVAGPLLVTIPSHLATVGRHVVDMEFETHPSLTGYLREPTIGPIAQLEADYAKKQFTLVYLPVALGIVSVMVALVFFAAYRSDPSAAGIAWLMAGLVSAAMSVLGLYVSLPEEAMAWMTRLRAMAFNCSYLFFLFAVAQMRARANRVFMVVITSIFATFAVAMLFVEQVRVAQLSALWIPVSYGLGLYLLYRVIQLSTAPPRRLLPLLPIAFVPLYTLHDVLGISDGGRFWVDQLLIMYNPPMFAFALMFILVSRAKLHASSMMQMNVELEARVKEKHDELEENYERIAATERREAALGERERMVRDMHDGLGSQLVSTLAMVESGQFSAAEVESALRDSLDDLRMMVHSLDQRESHLVDLLAMVRERIEPRITRQGMRFKWLVDDLPDSEPLDSETAGHVLRIVQESLTNIIKHANAETITLGTGFTAAERFIFIEDDGRGLAADCLQQQASSAGGRGLRNMRQRAEQLGGRLEVTDNHTDEEGSGTRVTLWLPA